jgi:hypothetical protein
MTKQEAIQKAYGKHWEIMKDNIDDNGYYSWTDTKSFFSIDNLDFTTSKDGLKLIPKSLQGIENNNGWIKIESEEDLPKNSDDIEFFVAFKENTSFIVSTRVFYKGKFVNDYQINIQEYDDLHEQPTHYQPIIKPEPPIY